MALFSVAVLAFATNSYAEAQKIVSVGGTITEIIYALGGGTKLVADDTTSYYPEMAAKLPKVGYQRALSAEGILSMKPDTVIAGSEAGPETALEQVKASGVNVKKVNMEYNVTGLENAVNEIATIIGREKDAKKVIAKLEANKKSFDTKYSGKFAEKKVLILMTSNPTSLMAVGKNTPADALINLIGAKNAAADLDGFKPVNYEYLAANKPDLIVIAEHGKSEQSYPDLEKLNVKVIHLDTVLTLGFGPRVFEAATKIAEKL